MESKKERIFATCNIGDEAISLLKQHFEVELYPEDLPPPKNLIIEKIKSGIIALITTLRDPIDAEVIASIQGQPLKIIAQDAVGFDNIDVQAATRHHLPIAHTPDVLTDSTAEFALAMLLSAARGIVRCEHLVRNNEWGCWHPFKPFLGRQVTGKSVAVIGTGRIGKAFIRKCIGFDMDILCHDAVYEDKDFVRDIQQLMDMQYKLGLVKRKNVIKYTDFNTAIANADFISLHVPLIRDGNFPTFHLINKQSIKLMKRDCYIINTSRGPVVDEQDLAQALIDGTIAGAALDVFEKEPLPKESILRDARLEGKLRLSPHFASATYEARLSLDPSQGMAGRTVHTLIDFLIKKIAISDLPIVNKDSFK